MPHNSVHGNLLANSRRKPWPFDIIIDPGSGQPNVGVMLKADEQGILVSKRAQPLEATPTSFEYGSQTPFLEKSYEFKELFMGMGARTQEAGQARRYYYALNVDASVNGRWIKGPKFTELPLVATYRDGVGGSIATPTAVTTTVTGAHNSSTTTLTVAATAAMTTKAGASQFPFYVKVNSEYLKVTAAPSGTTFTVVRGALGSTAASHSNGATVTLQAGGLSSVIGGAVTQIVLSDYDGGEYKFVAAGRALFMLDGDVPLHVYDFGYSSGAITIHQMNRFKHAGATACSSLWMGLSNGKLAELPGTTLAASGGSIARTAGNVIVLTPGTTGPTISPTGTPEAVGTVNSVGDELWFGYNNLVQKCEAEPHVAANWAGAITIGDGTAEINWLTLNHDELFIAKEDGIYTISREGFDQELYPGLRITPSLENGKQATVWQDHLYVPFRDGFYKISADGELKPIGTEQLLDNGSEVQGRIMSFTGHHTWFGYVVLFNERNGCSYLMKYGSWIEHDQGSLDTRVREVLRFRDVYHGALKKWSGTIGTPSKATHTSVQPMGAETNDRLYVGFSNGRLEHTVLPRGGPNPANDPNCRFTTDDAEIYWPIHHAGFQADQKAFHGFSVFGPKLDGLNWVEQYYNTDPAMADFINTNSNVAERGFYVPMISDLMDAVLGTATSATSTTLSDTSATWTVNAYRGKMLRIADGLGVGQERFITDNTATQLTVSPAFTITPDTTSQFEIYDPPTHFSVSGQRQDWPEHYSPPVTGKSIVVKSVLKSASSFDATTGLAVYDSTSTPVVEGAALHEAIRPAFIMEYQFTVQARNYAAKRDGSADRRRAERIRAQMIALVESVPTVTLFVPQEEEQEISFIDYAETLRENQKRYGLEWDITVRGVQYRTLSTAGQSGGSQSDLTNFTYIELENYTYEQLEELI